MELLNKSYAKINVFLKIVGKRDNYHLLASRFSKVYNLYDIIEFKQNKSNEFILEGNFSCETRNNTIYKAYLKMCEISPRVQFYFKSHKVVVKKNIPEFSGLGGGSSNAATFMLMVNKVCNLQLSKDDLAIIAVNIGADVPFFIYEYNSANVSGIGEIVDEFDEEKLDIEIFTPNIKCDTKDVFNEFSNNFYKEISNENQNELFKSKSVDILNKYTLEELNDLYKPSISLYSELDVNNLSLDDNYFFTGSGSSFFKIDGYSN